MVKDFLLTRAAVNLDPKTLQDYLELKHAPLALSLPLLARETKRYTMNHARLELGDYSNILYPPLERMATVVEHVFGAGISGLHADEKYIAEVRPDEMFMVESLMDGAPQFLPIEQEIPIFNSGSSSMIRVLEFVRRPTDMAIDDFYNKLAEDGDWAASEPRYRAAVERRVHSIVGSGSGVADFGADKEAIDAVIESWITDMKLLSGLSEEQETRRSAFCDPDRSFSVISDERWLYGLFDAFGRRPEGATVHAPEIIG